MLIWAALDCWLPHLAGIGLLPGWWYNQQHDLGHQAKNGLGPQMVHIIRKVMSEGIKNINWDHRGSDILQASGQVFNLCNPIMHWHINVILHGIELLMECCN